MVKLAVYSRRFDKPSETYIRDHVRHILPGRTVVLTDNPAKTDELGVEVLADVGKSRPRGRLARAALQAMGFLADWRDPSVTGETGERVTAYLKRQSVSVVLAEPGTLGCVMRKPCLEARLPLFVHFHGKDALVTGKSWFWRRHYRKLFADSAGIIVPSRFLADALISLGCPTCKLHVSPNGANSEKFRPSLRVPGRVLAVGRLTPGKAPLTTIAAFAGVLARMPQIRLDIVGAGALREACEALIRRLGIEGAVTLHGPLSHDRVAELFSQASLFIQHSVRERTGWEESFGIVFLEAAFSGIPVVATRCGGIPEVVVDGKTGLLVDQNDQKAMTDAMLRLLGDDDYAQGLGEYARERALSEFTLDQTARRLREIMGLEADIRP